MVDSLRLRRLLRRLADDVAILEAESRADDQRRHDAIWLRGVKYTFVTAIEGCVDIAQHLCASEGWGPPDDNGDAVRLLGVHGVMSVELATAMRKAVGFRNVLVHDYVDVDDEVVVERLSDLRDLRRFISRIGGFLDQRIEP